MQARKAHSEAVVRIGGKLSNGTFTHLITPAPSRGEKFLVTLAGGRFALHPDYIKKCIEKGDFVDEAPFEYGNPNMLPELAEKFADLSPELVRSAYKWRNWKATEPSERYKNGAFTDFVFALAVPEERRSPFTNILTSGGGKQVEIDFKIPLKPALLKRQNINICFYSGKELPKDQMKILSQCKIPYKNTSFINDYLMSDDLPIRPQ